MTYGLITIVADTFMLCRIDSQVDVETSGWNYYEGQVSL